MPQKSFKFQDKAYALVLYNNESLQGVPDKLLDDYPELENEFCNYLERYCLNCLKNTKGKKPCKHCRLAQFCSPKCFDEGYQWHEVECKAFQACENVEVRNDGISRLIAKIIARSRIDGGDMTPRLTEKFGDELPNRKLQELMPHTERWEKDHEYTATLSNFRQLFGGDSAVANATDQEILEIFGKIMTNSYAVYSEHEMWGSANIGSAMFLNMSYFNHDCDPEMVWGTTGHIQTAYVVKDVPETKPLIDFKLSYDKAKTIRKITQSAAAPP